MSSRRQGPASLALGAAPLADCALCPRLAAFRADNRRAFPDWHNAPVPSFDMSLYSVGSPTLTLTYSTRGPSPPSLRLR